jgi:hypothetical protein
MTAQKQTSRRFRSVLAGSVACALTLLSVNTAFADNACDANKGDLKIALQAFKEAAANADTSIRDGFEDATSTNYRDALFDSLDDMNEGASQAYDLVSEYYDIEENVTEFALGEMQNSLPPVVTLTMENAVDLAQTAADEESTNLELAELRCSQDFEDAALGVALDSLADPDTKANFYSAHKKVCKLVQVLGMLQKKHEQLEEIRETGYPLFYLHKKDKKTFADTYKRTVQFKVDLRMYPEYPDDLMGQDGEDQEFLLGQIEGIRLSYNTYFKWSDNDWGTINLYQFLLSDMDEDYFCVDLIKISNNAKAALCVGIADIDTDDEIVKLKLQAQFKFEGDKKSISIGTVEVPMPFGYLADVSDMKESAMQNVKKTIGEELMTAVEEMVEASGIADEVKDSCGL